MGREDDLARLPALLAEHRAVTIVGPGGVGKTRLALELLGREGDDAIFVDLVPVTDDALVGETVLGALGVQANIRAGMSSDEVLAELSAVLGRNPRLIVLDNGEHVVAGCAAVVEAVLGRTADGRVMTTSREPLGVNGECVHRLRSMRVDGADVVSEAVELFLRRGRRADSTFSPTEDQLEIISSICHRLDGLPLAIEFAAARVGHLPVEEIEARIAGSVEGRLSLLAAGRDRTSRHATMLAALEWSHDLLDDDERRLLRRLSVFAGSFSLALAVRVCWSDDDAQDLEVDDTEVLAVLARLVDKSLVVAELGSGRARYRLLETVRAFAAAKLAEAGTTARYRQRHSRSVLDWLEGRPWGASQSDVEFADAFLEELGNVRSALDWASASGDAEMLGRLAARSGLAWSPTVGHGAEGVRWLDAALANEADLAPTTRAACWSVRSLASMTRGLAEQERDAERAIEIGETLDGAICEALGTWALAAANRAVGANDPALHDVAHRRLDELRAAARQHDPERWLPYARMYDGMVGMVLGDVSAAAAAYDMVLGFEPLAWTHRHVLGPEIVTCRYLIADHRGAVEAADRLAGGYPTSLPERPMLWAARAAAQAALEREAEAAADLTQALSQSNSDIFLELNSTIIYAAAFALETGRSAVGARLLGASTTFGGAGRADFPFRSPCAFALYRHLRGRLRRELDDDTRRDEVRLGRGLADGDVMTLLREIADG